MKTIRKPICIILMLLMLSSVFLMNTSAVTVHVEDFRFDIDSSTNEATIVEYTGDLSDLIIPTKVYDYDVTAIGASAFSGNDTLKSVTIPSTIHTIGDNAFINCTALENIVIPQTVTTLGKSVFLNCSSLKSAQVEADIDILPQGTFQNCTSLETVVLSDSITTVKNLTFYNCESLSDVAFIENITSIGQSAFYNIGAQEIVLSENLQSIGRYTFAECKNLLKITISDNVQSIDKTAFKNSYDVTICCNTDSIAHVFATENVIDYILLDVVDKGILGDVDGDNNVSIMDATKIQMVVAQLKTFTEQEKLRADVDGDTEISVIDATAIQMHLAQKSIDYPIGQPIQ